MLTALCCSLFFKKKQQQPCDMIQSYVCLLPLDDLLYFCLFSSGIKLSFATSRPRVVVSLGVSGRLRSKARPVSI